jgi:HEAT repeat protein
MDEMITAAQNDQAERFERTIALLQDSEATPTAEAIYSLSDLYGAQLEQFQGVWNNMSADRRRQLVLQLTETIETNLELDFGSIIHPALQDAEPAVRSAAVEGVHADSPNQVVEVVMRLAQDDPFSEVRAAAARALGQFVLKGELGKLPENLNTRLQDTVLALYKNLNEDLDVRRRALEAAGNCSREGVAELIREAYYADDLPMRASAVFAMGRSYDETWAPQILEELTSDHPEMRFEAARAAGELELNRAVPHLAELALDDDREIQEMAIWALGEIGGQQADGILGQLAALADDAEDDELAQAVAEAQGSALLAGDDMMPLLDFGDFDLDVDEMLGQDYIDSLDESDL